MSKTAIVTGGAKGIGAAISSLLCKNGYNVVINYKNSKNDAMALQEKLSKDRYSALIFNADVSDPKQVNAMVDYTLQKFKKIDLLVNNAGIAQQKFILDINDNDWTSMISNDLSSVFYCTRQVLHSMLKNHSGSIVNISSIWGICGASCESHYSAAKSGIIGYTKALAKELGPSNIRVNCVAPGVIKTDMLNAFTDEDIASLFDNTPLCRIGTPDDVAKAVLFLASDDASFITGQILNVDGGFAL